MNEGTKAVEVEVMDHDVVEDQHIAQRYVMGRLSAAEAARFEEHYLQCDECLERLAAAESLERGLRGMMAQQLAAVAAIGARTTWRRAGLGLAAAALVLLALIPAGWLYRRAERLEGDLERTRTALAAERAGGTHKPIEEPVEVDALLRQLAAVEEENARLAAAAAERQRLTERLEETSRPRINVPLALLSPVRSTSGTGAPPTQLLLSSSQEWVILELELEEPLAARYRAILRRQDGEITWRQEGLVANDFGHLLIAFPTRFLKPGDYQLRIEGASADSEPASEALFTFRVAPGGS